MSDNVFLRLLVDLQKAYAKHGDSLFCLTAFRKSEVPQDSYIWEKAGYVGFVPLPDDDLDGYMILAPNTGKFESPFAEFRRLARKGGAALPLTIRKAIPIPPADPASWWLTFLWWSQPPSDEDLSPPDGELRKQRVPFAEPFLESAVAIERCRLNSDAPVFPPLEEPDEPGKRGEPEAELLVTAAEVAEIVHLEPNSLKNYRNIWPKPQVAARGRRAAEYSWQELRPVLVKQFPEEEIPMRPPDPKGKSSNEAPDSR